MTELIIDGTHAVLPQDFSVSVKRENPLFTKNGEYTYDITLQLSNPTNASLYEHLNRLTSVTEVRSERSAVLIADNRVYCNGTEVITAWTDDTVSIQIASGNSELNYVIGGDLMISFLDMKETVPDLLTARTYIEKHYPEVDYNLAPVSGDNADYNQYFRREGFSYISPVDGNFLPQPYLMAYINEVIRALGYTMQENQLEDTVYKDLYICHANRTDKWNEMLPGWSVLDFLTQLETLFNAVFVVDNRKRSVRLMLKQQFYAGTATQHVLQVKDEYEAEVEEDPDQEDMADSNISYSLPDDEFWRFARLSDAVKDAAAHDVIPADYNPVRGDRLITWFADMAHQKTDTLYTDELTGRQYLFIGKFDEESNRGTEYIMVDQFADLKRSTDSPSVELDMIPATLEETQVELGGDAGIKNYAIWLPSVCGGDADESAEGDTEDSSSLADMIRNGNSDSESKEPVRLAFYNGLYAFTPAGGPEVEFPIPYIDEFRISPTVMPVTGRLYERTNTVGASLRLQKLDELCYQGAYDIDYRNEITIESYDPNVYDPRMIFEIANRRYVCKEMEYTLDANGRKGPWKGTFCRINISDTEADARWILSDGKWRDGGVWLDNGRWLDE